jgi:amino acid adenylation domain-containing protein
LNDARTSREELLRSLEALSPERRELLGLELAREAARRRPGIPRLERGHGTSHLTASPAQERLYYLNELAPRSPTYLVPVRMDISGPLDPRRMEAALTSLIGRHEILRTGFVPDPGRGVVQVIHPVSEIRPDMTTGAVPAAEVDDHVRSVIRRPFDLTRPPLLRAGLWRIDDADDRWVLAICLHHIVADGWSLRLLIADLRDAYHGHQPDPRPDRLQYADYAAWQRDREDSAGFVPHLDYWRERLASPPVADFGANPSAPPGDPFAGTSVPVSLPAGLAAGLRRLGDAEHATLFQVLLAGAAIAFTRWAGEREIIIGTPVAGRGLPELEDMVGNFVNTLPLRIAVDDRQTVRSLVTSVKSICLDAYAHQDVSFDRLVRLSGATRHAGQRSPLAQVMLALTDNPAPGIAFDGLAVELADVPTEGAHMDASFELTPAPDGGLSGWLVFSAAVFDEESAGRLAESLRAALAAMAADPGQLVRAVPIVPPAERQRLLRTLSGAGVLAGPGELAHAAFLRQAALTPHRVAVLDDDPAVPPSACRARTFGEVDRESARLASWLRKRGAGCEDRVGVLLSGSDLVVSVLGVWRAGAVYVPLDPALPGSRLAAIAADAAPGLVISRSDFGDRLGSLPDPCQVVFLDQLEPELRSAAAVPPESAVRPGNASYVLYTSGSSGKPKGVIGTHRALSTRIDGLISEFGFGADDVVLARTPASFDPALWEMLVPLSSGGRLVTAAASRRSEPRYLAEAVQRHQVTSLDAIPALLSALLDDSDSVRLAGTLRRVLCGGDRLPPELAARCADALPRTRLHNLYGPTETTIEVSIARSVTAGPGRAGQVPIGVPVPGSRLYVLAPGGEPQPVGARGELYVGGAQLARGYLGQPGLTAAAFVPDPFGRGERLYRTGDLARWRPDGALEFAGRADSQVKIRGHRVEPEEVAALVQAQPDVADAVVVARDAGSSRVRLICYVTAVPGTGPADTPGLARAMRDLLPEPMVPAAWMELPELPRLPSGKIDRAALPDPAAPAPRSAAGQDTAPGPVEEVLLAVWSDVLGTEVSTSDDFFELGGHSLLATIIVTQIRDLLRLELSLSEFIDAPTVAASAGIIRRTGREQGVDADEAARLVLRVAAMTPAEVAERLSV